jgi:hypothetical protein
MAVNTAIKNAKAGKHFDGGGLFLLPCETAGKAVFTGRLKATHLPFGFSHSRANTRSRSRHTS